MDLKHKVAGEPAKAGKPAKTGTWLEDSLSYAREHGQRQLVCQ